MKHLAFIKALADYRQKSSALTVGKTLQYQPKDDVYVYLSGYTEKQRVMVIVNASRKKIPLTWLHKSASAGELAGCVKGKGYRSQQRGKYFTVSKTSGLYQFP